MIKNKPRQARQCDDTFAYNGWRNMIIEAGRARVWPRKDAAAHEELWGVRGVAGKGEKHGNVLKQP